MGQVLFALVILLACSHSQCSFPPTLTGNLFSPPVINTAPVGSIVPVALPNPAPAPAPTPALVNPFLSVGLAPAPAPSPSPLSGVPSVTGLAPAPAPSGNAPPGGFLNPTKSTKSPYGQISMNHVMNMDFGINMDVSFIKRVENKDDKYCQTHCLNDLQNCAVAIHCDWTPPAATTAAPCVGNIFQCGTFSINREGTTDKGVCLFFEQKTGLEDTNPGITSESNCREVVYHPTCRDWTAGVPDHWVPTGRPTFQTGATVSHSFLCEEGYQKTGFLKVTCDHTGKKTPQSGANCTLPGESTNTGGGGLPTIDIPNLKIANRFPTPAPIVTTRKPDITSPTTSGTTTTSPATSSTTSSTTTTSPTTRSTTSSTTTTSPTTSSTTSSTTTTSPTTSSTTSSTTTTSPTTSSTTLSTTTTSPTTSSTTSSTTTTSPTTSSTTSSTTTTSPTTSSTTSSTTTTSPTTSSTTSSTTTTSPTTSSTTSSTTTTSPTTSSTTSSTTTTSPTTSHTTSSTTTSPTTSSTTSSTTTTSPTTSHTTSSTTTTSPTTSSTTSSTTTTSPTTSSTTSSTTTTSPTTSSTTSSTTTTSPTTSSTTSSTTTTSPTTSSTTSSTTTTSPTTSSTTSSTTTTSPTTSHTTSSTTTSPTTSSTTSSTTTTSPTTSSTTSSTTTTTSPTTSSTTSSTTTTSPTTTPPTTTPESTTTTTTAPEMFYFMNCQDFTINSITKEEDWKRYWIDDHYCHYYSADLHGTEYPYVYCYTSNWNANTWWTRSDYMYAYLYEEDRKGKQCKDLCPMLIDWMNYYGIGHLFTMDTTMTCYYYGGSFFNWPDNYYYWLEYEGLYP